MKNQEPENEVPLPKNANGSVLRADDFKVGMFITILRHHNKIPSVNENGVWMIDDKGLVGYPMEVLAIDFPFIAVDIYDAAYKTFFKTNLDIRTQDFKALSDEYVDALLPDEDIAPKTDNIFDVLKAYGYGKDGKKEQ